MKALYAQALDVASQGIGKIFDHPYAAVLSDDPQQTPWFDGQGIPFSTWLTSLSARTQQLIFSYELPLEVFNQVTLKKNLTLIFLSLNVNHPEVTVRYWQQQGNHVLVDLQPEANELNHVFYDLENPNFPFIAQSFGMSLDGKIATRTGDSKYISGPEVLEAIHALRHRYQAILVGINTVLLDHPKLTTRLKNRLGHSPIRIILDSQLRISPDEPLLHQVEGETWIVTQMQINSSIIDAFKMKGVKIIQVPLKNNHLDLRATLIQLKARGIYSILVEGGATIHGAFLDQGLTHRVYASISPMLIGGQTAKTPIAGEGFATLKEALKLKWLRVDTYGNDLFITAKK